MVGTICTRFHGSRIYPFHMDFPDGSSFSFRFCTLGHLGRSRHEQLMRVLSRLLLFGFSQRMRALVCLECGHGLLPPLQSRRRYGPDFDAKGAAALEGRVFLSIDVRTFAPHLSRRERAVSYSALSQTLSNHGRWKGAPLLKGRRLGRWIAHRGGLSRRRTMSATSVSTTEISFGVNMNSAHLEVVAFLGGA